MTDKELKEDPTKTELAASLITRESEVIDKAIDMVSMTLLWLYGMKLFIKLVKHAV